MTERQKKVSEIDNLTKFNKLVWSGQSFQYTRFYLGYWLYDRIEQRRYKFSDWGRGKLKLTYSEDLKP